MKSWISEHATIRVRLTALYGGLFLLAGMILLGVTYLLVKQSVDARFSKAAAAEVQVVDIPKEKLVQLQDGRKLDTAQFKKLLAERQTAYQEATTNSLLTRGGIALGLVTVIALAFGWLIAERALRPVHRITETARRVADRNLHERIALDGPRDEIRELADTFDTMLERLDRSFEGQRRFVANASHELRTPLTINRTLLEVAVGRPGASADVRHLGETLLAVNARHEQLIDGLLTLAQSEGEVAIRHPVDLADVVRHVSDQLTAEALAAGVDVRRDTPPAVTAGDPVLIERLVQNLIQNGLRHNVDADGWLSVRTMRHGETVELTVRNSGPVVPRYEIPGLFEPFRRLAGDRTDSARGVGLGLSIVRSVARVHGGEVSAEPLDGGGLIVRVTLPAAATPETPAVPGKRATPGKPDAPGQKETSRVVS